MRLHCTVPYFCSLLVIQTLITFCFLLGMRYCSCRNIRQLKVSFDSHKLYFLAVSSEKHAVTNFVSYHQRLGCSHISTIYFLLLETVSSAAREMIVIHYINIGLTTNTQTMSWMNTISVSIFGKRVDEASCISHRTSRSVDTIDKVSSLSSSTFETSEDQSMMVFEIFDYR